MILLIHFQHYDGCDSHIVDVDKLEEPLKKAALKAFETHESQTVEVGDGVSALDLVWGKEVEFTVTKFPVMLDGEVIIYV